MQWFQLLVVLAFAVLHCECNEIVQELNCSFLFDGRYTIQVAENISTKDHFIGLKEAKLKTVAKKFGMSIGIGAATAAATGFGIGMAEGVVIATIGLFNIFTTAVGLAIFGIASLFAASIAVPLYLLTAKNTLALSPDRALVWELKNTNDTTNTFTLDNIWEKGSKKRKFLNFKRKTAKLSKRGAPMDMTARCTTVTLHESVCYLQLSNGKWFHAGEKNTVSLETDQMTLWRLVHDDQSTLRK